MVPFIALHYRYRCKSGLPASESPVLDGVALWPLLLLACSCVIFSRTDCRPAGCLASALPFEIYSNDTNIFFRLNAFNQQSPSCSRPKSIPRPRSSRCPSRGPLPARHWSKLVRVITAEIFINLKRFASRDADIARRHSFRLHTDRHFMLISVRSTKVNE